MTIKRILLWGVVAVGVAFLAIQFVPYGRDHANRTVRAEPKWDSAATRAFAAASCDDCHSNRTKWPWYSNIAPLSWLVQRDVEEGRAAFNYSEPGFEGDESGEMVANGEMPPFYYQITHPDARLPDADKAAFVRGLRATFGGGGGD
jgi:mono/diheme cytochrome c family protein